ncbi:MAG TPA: BON domain-containing protein [Anaerolineae bacterium]|nr:BON domain-containing protein [Anaerolineae bacterium]
MERIKTDIRQAVLEQLANDERVSVERVDVMVNDGQVTLRGTAPSYRSKWAAAEAARRVWGVYSVDNEIEVRLTAPNEDQRIATDIRNALMRDADLDSRAINVDVHEGHVTLRGTVATGWAKSRAEEDVRWARGVVGVTNQLVVVPSSSATDRDLAPQIEQALRRDAAVNADNIDVVVDSRHATLNGIVRNWAERNAALEDALHVPGVVDVRDGLSIRYEAERPSLPTRGRRDLPV